MSKRKWIISGVTFIVLLIGVLLPVHLFLVPSQDGSYHDVANIKYTDSLFYPGPVSIPLQVKWQGGSPSLFKVKENTTVLKERFEAVSTMQVTTNEETSTYFIIEVQDEKGQVSNALVYEVTDNLPDPMEGWHYYEIRGLYMRITFQNSYCGSLYAPIYYFSGYLDTPVYLSDMTLRIGEEYAVNATIDEFEAFYQRISDQYGVVYERQNNTLILSSGFFENSEATTTLTFSEGKVRVDFEENLEIVS